MNTFTMIEVYNLFCANCCQVDRNLSIRLESFGGPIGVADINELSVNDQGVFMKSLNDLTTRHLSDYKRLTDLYDDDERMLIMFKILDSIKLELKAYVK